MNLFDDENEIILSFQLDDGNRKLYLPCLSRGAAAVFKVVHSQRKWRYWTNNSGKSDPPPDFYSDKFGYMMEVMRVDDHAHVNENGVLVNPVNQRESAIQKEIRQKILEKNPDADFDSIKIMINADPKLPSLENHNYRFYEANFERVLKKHIERIPLYRKNQPGKKLIFFVFDESTGYLQTDDAELAARGPIPLEPFTGVPVWHFLDRRFIDVFRSSDIDYLIWYTPYKRFYGTMVQPPQICVFDVKKHQYKCCDYSKDLIISSEA